MLRCTVGELGVVVVSRKDGLDVQDRVDDGREDDLAAPVGRWQQFAIALGGILGSGWLIAIPTTESLGWWALISWVLGGSMVVLIAVVLVQLAKADQRPGGLAWWPTRTSGLVAGTVVNAGLFLVYAGNPPAGSSTATMLMSSLYHNCDPLPHGDQACSWGRGLNWDEYFLALAVMTALFLVHAIGSRLMLRLNIALSALKAIVLLLLPISAWFTGVRLLPVLGPPEALEGIGNPLALAAAATTAGGILFAFTGFQGPVDHGARQGKQHRGFAIIGSLLAATVIYLLLQLVYTAGAENVPGGWTEFGTSNPTSVLLVIASLLAPLTNALLFISLAGIVLGKSAEQDVLLLPKRDWRMEWRVYPVVWLVGAVYLLLARIVWSEISDSKSVIYLLVYSYAAISYCALQRTGIFKDRRYLHRTLRVLAPISFVVATVLAYYARFPSLLWACGLITAVGGLMFLTKLRQQKQRHWTVHWRQGWWLLAYLLTLLALSGIQFAYRIYTSESTTSVCRAENHVDPECYSTRHVDSMGDVLLGFEGLPAFAGDNLYLITTHGLAVVAAVAGYCFFRMGVQASVDYLKFTDRSAS